MAIGDEPLGIQFHQRSPAARLGWDMVYVFLFIKEPWVTPKTVTPKLQKNTNKSQKSKRHLIYKKNKNYPKMQKNEKRQQINK